MTSRSHAPRVAASLVAGLWLVALPAAFAPASAAAADPPATAPSPSGDAARFPIDQRRFEQVVRQYVQDRFEFRPDRATMSGMHAFDAKLPNLTPETIEAEERSIGTLKANLSRIDRSKLDEATQIDFDLYRHRMDQDLYELQEDRPYEDDPGFYNFGYAIDLLISQEFAPRETRLRSIVGRLREVPRFLEQGRALLKRPPALFTQFAIDEFPGTVDYIAATVPKAFASVKDQALWKDYEAALAGARKAVETHVAWMRETLLPRSDGSFVLGAERYRKKLWHDEMVGTPLDTLLAIGTREMERLQGRFRAAAARFAPGATLEEAMAKARRNHPPRDSLLAAASAILEGARAYSISSGFLAMPSDERCTVRPTPEFAASRSFASLDAPGPLETTGRRGYYNVTLPDAEWDSTRTEEYLQGFSRGSLSSVSLHEAYPGHYAHYLWARDVPSLARKTAGCGSFAEGWALYVEEAMLDHGYGGGDPELELGMLRWALVRACRFQVGLRVHTKGMTIEEATKYFQDYAHMEPVNAQREAYRAAFDPTYIIYTLGALQIRKLRDDFKREQGERFDLGQFHATILSQGSLPVVLLRRLLLREEGESL